MSLAPIDSSQLPLFSDVAELRERNRSGRTSEAIDKRMTEEDVSSFQSEQTSRKIMGIIPWGILGGATVPVSAGCVYLVTFVGPLMLIPAALSLAWMGVSYLGITTTSANVDYETNISMERIKEYLSSHPEASFKEAKDRAVFRY